MNRIEIKLLQTDIDPLSSINFVSDERSGGLNVFIGNVRNHTQGAAVLKLEFEAYEPMAIKEMKKIAEEAIKRYDLNKISIQHRTGTLLPKETAVVIAVSSDHRDAAFRASRFCIDRLKETVPIWKKEFLENGAIWVSAHP